MATVAENAVFVEKVLPVVRRFVAAKFRYLPPYAKDEQINNAISLAYEHFCRLWTKGRDASKFPVALAKFACLRIRSFRGIGRQNSLDLLSELTQRKRGIERQPLEDYAERRPSALEEVDTRLDFQDWLSGLTPARRRVMEALARGMTTARAAAELGCGEHNVQYLRDKCRRLWKRDHAAA
jgi:hypothetical protein